MRLSEVLGLGVTDADGARVGRVADVVLVQDGPVRGPYQASLRVAGLIVVERRHMQLMGYERDVLPHLVRWIMQHLAGTVRHIRWEDVAGVDADGVTLAVATASLEEHDPGARRPA